MWKTARKKLLAVRKKLLTVKETLLMVGKYCTYIIYIKATQIF